MSEQVNETVPKSKLKLLVDGKLPLADVHRLLRMPVKDNDRFWKYLEVLQERVSWKEKNIAPYLRSPFCGPKGQRANREVRLRSGVWRLSRQLEAK